LNLALDRFGQAFGGHFGVPNRLADDFLGAPDRLFSGAFDAILVRPASLDRGCAGSAGAVLGIDVDKQIMMERGQPYRVGNYSCRRTAAP
jgi:hypothetical protein